MLETDLVSEFFPELQSIVPCRLPDSRESAVSQETDYSRGMGVVLPGPRLLFLIRELAPHAAVCHRFIDGPHWLQSLTHLPNACKPEKRETEKAFLSWRFAELELVFGESPHAITPLLLQSGKFSGGSPAPPSQPQGLSYAEDAAEHENMKAVLKTSSPAVEDATPALGVRTRSRASRGNTSRVPPQGTGDCVSVWEVDGPLPGALYTDVIIHSHLCDLPSYLHFENKQPSPKHSLVHTGGLSTVNEPCGLKPRSAGLPWWSGG